MSPMRSVRRGWPAVLLAGVMARVAFSGGVDWPQFLGPQRDGVYQGDDVIQQWPHGGPTILWHLQVGEGWSAPVAVDGKLILFHRVNDSEKLDCLEATTGKPIWQASDPTAYQDDFGFDQGPRATPVIARGHIFTFGAEGRLNCREFDNGKLVWTVNTKARFGQDKGYFGMACSPLVEEDAVILNIGGHGAGIVAFDRNNGKTLWEATDDAASYSSPTAATIAGKRYVLVFTRAGLAALEPSSGKVFFQFPWRAGIDASVNAATPLVIDDDVFISASYQTGAALLHFDEKNPRVVWSGDDILSNHYSTSVYHGGFLYGFDGRQEQGQHLRCVEAKTGKVRWSEDDFGAGTLMLVDRPTAPLLLILSEKGELVMAPATPDGFKPMGRKELIGFETRAYAALAHGLYFARGKRELVCVDLRKVTRASSP